jgi:hypothetical protein
LFLPDTHVAAVDLEPAVAQQLDAGGQQLVLDRLDAVVERASVSSSRTSTARCATMGPWSTCSSTRWTVEPVSLTPYSSASRTAWAPRNAGSSEGWVLMTRSGQPARKPPRGCA